jgi:predicted AlkP superfamily pyrophosphatase or phosphodiesterase
LGDAVKAEFPKARSASVSGKDRASVLMGGKRSDFALWHHAGTDQFVSSAYYGRLPDWLWNWNGALRKRAPGSAGPAERLDALTLELARLLVEQEGFGVDGSPDVLAVSLSSLDRVGHRHGPDGPEVREHMKALDGLLGDFLAFLDWKIGRGAYVLALSSDHGVGGLPESEAGKAAGYSRLGFKSLLAYLDDELGRRLAPAPMERRWTEAIAQPRIYLDYETGRLAGVDPGRLRSEAAKALAAHPRVAAVHWPERLRRLSDGPFGPVFQRSVHEPRSGDLLVLFKEKVEPFYDDSETSAVHGLSYDYDALVPLILFGEGVKPGRRTGEVLTVDLAPTLAKALGLRSFKPVGGGRVLSE